MVKEKNKKIFLAFFIVLMVAGASLLIYTGMPLNKQSIPVRFYLAEKPGFEIELGQLTFGAIPVNQSASRGVSIRNDFDKPVKIEVSASGEIVDNVIVSENNFLLQPQEAKNLSFTAFTYGLIDYRAYEGQVTIITSRA